MRGSLSYRVLLFVMVMCGILAFAVANETPQLALLSLPGVIAAWIVSGSANGQPLPRWLINALLIAATGYLLLNLSGPATEYISELATYLTALQVIKLFDVRTPRDQSQIISLSVMLVIGSCLTSVTVDLAGVLVLYVPILLLTLIRHHIHAGFEASRVRLEESVPASVRAPQPGWFHGRRFRRNLWMLTLVTGASVGLTAAVIFLVMPRGIGGSMLGKWRPPSEGAKISFNNHIKLGGVSGLLSESQRIVMDVRVTATESRDQARIGTRPWYLRGAVLDQYQPERTLWSRWGVIAEYDREETRRSGHAGANERGRRMARSDPYVVDISMRNRQVEQLFTTWLPRNIDFASLSSAKFTYSPIDGTYLMDDDFGPLEYSIQAFLTENIHFDWTAKQKEEVVELPPSPSMAYFQSNERIRGLARQILSLRGIDIDAPFGEQELAAIPRFFEDHLTENYTYTTELVAPLPDEDPIEMFLFSEERGMRGHCEYFASALAALCQSVGINARVVTGYVATDYDESRKTFIVRESNAHAWVEAEIRPGRWNEYDPSPEADVMAAHKPKGGFRQWFRKFGEAIELAWVENVVRYDLDKQTEAFGSSGGDTGGIYGGLERLAEHFGLNADQGSVRRFLRLIVNAVGAGALAFGAAATLLFLLRTPLDTALVAVAGLLGFSWTRRTKPKEASLQSGFYGDLLRRLQEADLGKPEWQPPRAWANALRREHAGVGEHVESITDLYYNVRFAGVAHDDAIEAEARERLTALDTELAAMSAETAEDAT